MGKEQKYFKSPMNYIGNKYKLLPQILQYFPKDIDTFVDLFCGGLDVSLNVDAKNKICADKERHIIDFYSNILTLNSEEVVSKVKDIVAHYDLSDTNQQGFISLRSDYNAHLKDCSVGKFEEWVMFYALIAHSFNHQLRYNSSGEFNMPFGKNRSYFNQALEKRLSEFVDKIDDTYDFANMDFRRLFDFEINENSFVYADPPYLITTATYNENGGWQEQDEKDLLDLLDKVNEMGIKFGLSNVLSQNGKENTILKEWSKKYIVHNLSFNYGNSSYHRKERDTTKTEEVLICNFE